MSHRTVGTVTGGCWPILVRWLVVAALLAPLANARVAWAAGPEEQRIVVPAGRTVARAHGRLRSSTGDSAHGEARFALKARAGQTLRVRIVPETPGLVTAGDVTAPSGSQLGGGPGGLIFEGRLPQTGTYHLRVRRRAGPSSGQFRLSLEVRGEGPGGTHPPASGGRGS
jgi:hypothetical protein